MSADWLERVKEEKRELDERLGKLSDFLEDGSNLGDVTEDNIFLLIIQKKTMTTYSDVLGERIKINGG